MGKKKQKRIQKHITQKVRQQGHSTLTLVYLNDKYKLSLKLKDFEDKED